MQLPYRKILDLNLGNLEKIHSFLNNTVAVKIKDITQNLPDRSTIYKDINLDDGNDLTIMVYGNRYRFFTVKGEKLKALFEDWDTIQKSVEQITGSVQNDFPLIACGFDHVFRHVDSFRNASVNAGLLNCKSSTMCFWENGKLAHHLQYDVGEAYLCNVKNTHSIIIDDSINQYNFRAVLMWTTNDKYEDIIGRLNE